MKLLQVEFKKVRLSSLLWLLGLSLFMAVSITEYKALNQSGAAITEVMEAFPKAIKIIFGMNNLDIGTFVGYHSMIVFYCVVMLGVHGLFLGFNQLANEEADKTSEFLLTKPISRLTVVFKKSLVGIIIILLINLILYLIQYGLVDQSDHNIINSASWIMVSSHLFCYGLGSLLFGLFGQKGDKVGLTFILVQYFWPVLFDLISDNHVLRKFSLCAWFNEFNLNNPNNLFFSVCLVLILIGIGFIIFSSYFNKNKDIV